jgi:hypothetical protein
VKEKIDITADRIARWARAKERAARLQAAWEALDCPAMANGSTGQKKVHPLITAIASAEKDVDYFERWIPHDRRT